MGGLLVALSLGSKGFKGDGDVPKLKNNAIKMQLYLSFKVHSSEHDIPRRSDTDEDEEEEEGVSNPLPLLLRLTSATLSSP